MPKRWAMVRMPGEADGILFWSPLVVPVVVILLDPVIEESVLDGRLRASVF